MSRLPIQHARLERLRFILAGWARAIGSRGLALLVEEPRGWVGEPPDPTFLLIVDDPARLAFDPRWSQDLAKRGLGRVLSVHASRRHVEVRFAHAAGPGVVLRIHDPATLMTLRTRGALRPISDPDGLFGARASLEGGLAAPI